MTSTFIPKKFLNKREQELLESTDKQIRNARSQDELTYYKKVLDVLLSSAFERNKNEKEVIE